MNQASLALAISSASTYVAERSAAAGFGFRVLAHRNPDVGVNDVGACHRFGWVLDLPHARQRRVEAIAAGLATVSSAPSRLHASASERATLLASPMKAIRAPSIRPSSWRMVSMSASACSGWSLSDSMLSTGTSVAAAISSSTA